MARNIEIISRENPLKRTLMLFDAYQAMPKTGDVEIRIGTTDSNEPGGTWIWLEWYQSPGTSYFGGDKPMIGFIVGISIHDLVFDTTKILELF